MVSLLRCCEDQVLPGGAIHSGKITCYVLRPLIKTLFLWAPYGYIKLKNKKRIPKEMTVTLKLAEKGTFLD